MNDRLNLARVYYPASKRFHNNGSLCGLSVSDKYALLRRGQMMTLLWVAYLVLLISLTEMDFVVIPALLRVANQTLFRTCMSYGGI